MTTTRKNKRRARLIRKLAAYSAAAGAAGIATSEAADAAVIYSGLLNGGAGMVSTKSKGFYLDLDVDGNYDFRFQQRDKAKIKGSKKGSKKGSTKAKTGRAVYISASSSTSYLPLGPNFIQFSTTSSFANALAAGDFVSDTNFSSSFARAAEWTYTSGAAGPFAGNGPLFLGLKFRIGSDYHLGWARIQIDPLVRKLTLYDYAYETDPLTSIETFATELPAVPEPNSLALLATGAVGLAALRRRRKRAATQATSDSSLA